MKNATYFVQVCAIIGSVYCGSFATAADPSRCVFNKELTNGALRGVWTMSVRSHSQQIEYNGGTLTNVGCLAELRYGRGERLPGTNESLVWREFFISSLHHQRDTWVGDITVGPSTNEYILAISRGDSIGIYNIDLREKPNDYPAVVKGGGGGLEPATNAGTARLIRMPAHFYESVEHVESVTLLNSQEQLVVSVGLPRKGEKVYRFAWATHKWTNDE